MLMNRQIVDLSTTDISESLENSEIIYRLKQIIFLEPGVKLRAAQTK
jgi:hypothetical protein